MPRFDLVTLIFHENSNCRRENYWKSGVQIPAPEVMLWWNSSHLCTYSICFLTWKKVVWLLTGNIWNKCTDVINSTTASPKNKVIWIVIRSFMCNFCDFWKKIGRNPKCDRDRIKKKNEKRNKKNWKKMWNKCTDVMNSTTASPKSKIV